jgi:hypothetical protein
MEQRIKELKEALEVAERLLSAYGSGTTKHVDQTTGEALTPAMKQIRKALTLVV